MRRSVKLMFILPDTENPFRKTAVSEIAPSALQTKSNDGSGKIMTLMYDGATRWTDRTCGILGLQFYMLAFFCIERYINNGIVVFSL